MGVQDDARDRQMKSSDLRERIPVNGPADGLTLIDRLDYTNY